MRTLIALTALSLAGCTAQSSPPPTIQAIYGKELAELTRRVVALERAPGAVQSSAANFDHATAKCTIPTRDGGAMDTKCIDGKGVVIGLCLDGSGREVWTTAQCQWLWNGFNWYSMFTLESAKKPK